MLIFDQLQKSDRHLRALSWLIAAGLLVLLGGLWWVQVVRSRHYAENQRVQSYRTVRLPAPRGKILDRHGVVLAENRPVYNISLYLEDRALLEGVLEHYRRAATAARVTLATNRPPNALEKVLSWFGYEPSLTQGGQLGAEKREQLRNAARYAVTSNIVAQLATIIGQPIPFDEERLRKHYLKNRVLPFPILSRLSPAQVARLQERGLDLPGVDMEVQPTRVYPQRTLAAHTLGYLIRSEELSEGDFAVYDYWLPDYRGGSGVEAAFDEALRGHAGTKSVLVNSLGYRQTETFISPVEAGRNLTLTIDADIQRETERALNNAAVAFPPVRGAAVVLDVRSGEVVALASAPAFDPNDWIPFMPRKIYDTYTNKDMAPLDNRAIYGNYAPGSTFKIIVALAGLEAGVLDTNKIMRVEANPRDPAHGIYYVGNRRHPFKDTVQPGDYDFRRAFIKSSNAYFIDLGLRVTPQRIVALAEQFHFGERTGIALPDSRGLLPTADWVRRNRVAWSPVATGNLSIGQGDLDVTPLQLAVAVAAVANGGKVLTPQLVLESRGPDELAASETPKSLPPIVRDELRVSRASLATVQQAMFADVQDPAGSGSAAHVEGYNACGKTGTAQVERGARIDHFTWFASYAPYEDPRYAVVVMVDHGTSGGGTCAPVAREIYKALKYRDQKPPAARKDSFVKN